MRKTTSELTKFLALLTTDGEYAAFMSVKGELSWSHSLSIFGNSADDPDLDNFTSYVVPRIQEAMATDLYDGKFLSAKEVIDAWVDQMLSQTHFIATSYWHEIQRRNDDDDNPPMFKRSAVCPATFSECFPRIYAREMRLQEGQTLSDPHNCYTPQTPGAQTPSSMTPRTLLASMGYEPAEAQSIIDNRQMQIRALLEGGNAGGVGSVGVM
jgi:hypothetical protein